MDYPTKTEISWDRFELVKVREDREMLKVVEKLNVATTSNQFEQEIREVVNQRVFFSGFDNIYCSFDCLKVTN